MTEIVYLALSAALTHERTYWDDLCTAKLPDNDHNIGLARRRWEDASDLVRELQQQLAMAGASPLTEGTER